MAAPTRKAQDEAKPDIRGKLKQKKTEMIQEEILAAAQRLIAERGFRAVTVDHISAEMGFTKSIVYYHMKNKNEILWKIFERIDATYSEGLDEVLAQPIDTVSMMAEIVKRHCSNVLLNRHWSTIYNRDENELTEEQQKIVAANKREYNHRIQVLYARGVSEGVFRDTPPLIAVSCIMGACNWPYFWFKPNGKLTVDEIATGYANQLINGIVTD